MLVIHGAFRDADAYFCMMHGLMQAQDYRDPKDILIIAPDFSYKGDFGLFKSDAFWNNSHPWGDWRAGAHSDRRSGHGEAISSYHIIDGFMLALNNVSRFPNLNEIAIVGHSAGGQAVQRYALTTLLPPKVKNLPLPSLPLPPLTHILLPPPLPQPSPDLSPPPPTPSLPPKAPTRPRHSLHCGQPFKLCVPRCSPPPIHVRHLRLQRPRVRLLWRRAPATWNPVCRGARRQ